MHRETMAGVVPVELTIVSSTPSRLLRPFGVCVVTGVVFVLFLLLTVAVVTVAAVTTCSRYGDGMIRCFEASRVQNNNATETETATIHQSATAAAAVARVCPRVSSSEQKTLHGGDFHLLAGAWKRHRR